MGDFLKELKTAIMEKWLSRKLFAFLVTSGLLIGHFVTEDIWMVITITYMSANIAEGVVNAVMAKKNGSAASVVTEVLKVVEEAEKPKEVKKEE